MSYPILKTSFLLITMSLLMTPPISFAQSQLMSGKTQQENTIVHSVDSREVIWVNTVEKAALLSEMRHFLVASQAILEASLADDMERIEMVARNVGIKLMNATPEAILQKLPSGFTAIGPKTHLGFEKIANEASGLGDREIILNILANLQKSCIVCHSAYRFEVR